MPVITSILCYINSLRGDFVHDDIFAIIENPDVTGKRSLIDLWKNDFWGKPMWHETSHKSYRPICAWTFRLQHWTSGPNPVAFHCVNMILHSSATFMLTYLSQTIFTVNRRQRALITGILFAVHPIHSEAVSGIVGRADVLCCNFYLLALILHNSDRYGWFSYLLAFAAMLSKEQGITVLGIMFVMDLLRIIHRYKSTVHRLNHEHFINDKKSRMLLKNLLFSLVSAMLLIWFRMRMMNGKLPQFQQQENPAAFSSSSLTRILTFNYLLVFNVWLMLNPIQLSYDWQWDSIPLIQSICDLRNLATIGFYLVLVTMITRLYRHYHKNRYSEDVAVYLFGFMLLCFPFLPASNLVFYVGFVVAERVLYIPSAGFCMIISYCVDQVIGRFVKSDLRSSFYSLFSCYLLLLGVRCILRNQVWLSREALFRSGIESVPRNAKAHYNYANFLQDHGHGSEAMKHFNEAIRLYPNHTSALNNLGTLTDNQTEAERLFRKTIEIDPKHANAIFNLANIEQNKGNFAGAISLFDKAAECGYDDILSLLLQKINILIELEDYRLVSKVLDSRFFNVNHLSAHVCKQVANIYGILARHRKALLYIERAISSTTENKSYLAGLYSDRANHYRDLKLYEEAKQSYIHSFKLDPTVFQVQLNLGVIYHLQGDFSSAKFYYNLARRLKPDNQLVKENLIKLRDKQQQMQQ
ncbi:protein O-mannosyl-transferase TMTC1-like [Tubulanus polymorphus]|uniref:protein O-mannosyl-transferase TMTC1-like n=1 Tax=Tubulanus polymorphus TaxID=672921 RepID=UPI003DA40A7F